MALIFSSYGLKVNQMNKYSRYKSIMIMSWIRLFIMYHYMAACAVFKSSNTAVEILIALDKSLLFCTSQLSSSELHILC